MPHVRWPAKRGDRFIDAPSDGNQYARQDGAWVQVASVAVGTLPTDINTATPPTTEAVTGNYTIVDLAEDDDLATLGFNASNTLQLKNKMHGGTFEILTEDSGGTENTAATFDSNGAVTLMYDGNDRIETASLGMKVFGNASHIGGSIEGWSSDGSVERWELSATGSGILTLYNYASYFQTDFSNNVGGSQRTHMRITSGRVDFFDATNAGDPIVARTTTKAAGGLLVDAGSGLTKVMLDGDGLTESSAATITGAWVFRDTAGTFLTMLEADGTDGFLFAASGDQTSIRPRNAGGTDWDTGAELKYDRSDGRWLFEVGVDITGTLEVTGQALFASAVTDMQVQNPGTGVYSFMDVVGGVGRFGVYDWGGAGWQPITVQGSVLTLTGSTSITLTDDTTVQGIIKQEEASADVAATAGEGQWWVKDDAPCIPKFTDDEDTEWDVVTAIRSAAEPTTGTWTQGQIALHSAPVSSGPIGWVCLTSGTFSSATDATGDPDGSTAVIPGMTDTSDFNVGDWVTVSAGFPSASTPYKILSKTSTSVTLDTSSTSSQTDVTVATVDPTFETFGPITYHERGTYTPTWTGSLTNPAIGNGTLSGEYVRIGDMCTVNIYCLMGSTTTFGTGSWRWDLPFTPTTSTKSVGNCLLFEQGVAFYTGVCEAVSGTDYVSCFVGIDTAGGTGNPGNYVANNIPFVFANGDYVRIGITYTLD
jgi:hypothetical protein